MATPKPLSDREQLLIKAFVPLAINVLQRSDQHCTPTACKTVAAIGHELYMSLIAHGHVIQLDKTCLSNSDVPPEHPDYFKQVQRAGDFAMKLPNWTDYASVR